MKSFVRVPPKPVIIFSRQLGTLLGSGIPLVQGLQILTEQAEHERLKEALIRITAAVEGGAKFSDSLSRYPGIFPEVYVNSVAAGEEIGGLEMVLARLAETMKRAEKIASDIKAAVRYPLMVSVAIVGAALFLTVFVVPRFQSIYSRFKTDLPLPTKVLIASNQFLTHCWMFYVPAVILLILLARWTLRTSPGRMQWDTLKLRFPIFGPLFQKVVMARFAFLMLFLYKSGLPITRALDVVSRACGNVAVGREVAALRNSVETGQGLAGPMGKTRYFPPMVRHMVSIGEQSGKLPEMLENLVSYYEDEVSESIAALNGLIEPLLTVVLGVVVLGLSLAIFLPMWNLSQVLQQ